MIYCWLLIQTLIIKDLQIDHPVLISTTASGEPDQKSIRSGGKRVSARTLSNIVLKEQQILPRVLQVGTIGNMLYISSLQLLRRFACNNTRSCRSRFQASYYHPAAVKSKTHPGFNQDESRGTLVVSIWSPWSHQQPYNQTLNNIIPSHRYPRNQCRRIL